MKKWRWHYLISILMIPVLLLVCVRIYKTPHAEDIEQLFLEHREEFEQLADDLMKIADRNDPESAVVISKAYVGGNFEDQIDSLGYYSLGPSYPQEEYENIHSAVADLYASLNPNFLVFDQWGIQITLSLSYYGNCRLFYLPYDSSDVIGYQVEEKIVLPGCWHAVITND